MVRDTSLETYKSIQDSGVLSARRLEVYKALMDSGPSTASELWERMGKRSSQHNPVSPRLNELREMGAICEAEQRDCLITGRLAIVWEVTGRMPEKLEKRITSKQRISFLEIVLEDAKAVAGFVGKTGSVAHKCLLSDLKESIAAYENLS